MSISAHARDIDSWRLPSPSLAAVICTFASLILIECRCLNHGYYIQPFIPSVNQHYYGLG
ncbi:MAG: hypothetical protein ACTXOO_04625 [Sodalis sp. (in: enterobacteria)]